MIYRKHIEEKKNAHTLFCRHCGSGIKQEDFAMIYGKKAICNSCISELSMQELLRICEFQSKEDLLYSIGFTRI